MRNDRYSNGIPRESFFNRCSANGSLHEKSIYFLGIRAGERKKLVAEYLKENGAPQDLLGFTIALFAEEEREFQYVAIDLLSRYGKNSLVRR